MKTHRFDNVKIKFEKFLSLIGHVLSTENDINVIQNKLRRHFNTTTSDYLCSNEFITSLDHIQNKFIDNNKSTKYFTLLASFDEQLKKHSIKSSKSNPSLIQASNCASSITTSTESISTNEILLPNSTIEYDVSISDVQETIEHLLDQCCNILFEVNISKPSGIDAAPSITTTESKHQRKINRLERKLHRLSRVIRELEEKDMSLDEMVHCDLYVVESNLKKQAYELHAKLAELKSQSSSIERIIHQPITLNESETGHSLINEDLQEMVNKSKHFPSFSDVLDTVEKANVKYKLNLNEDIRRNFAEKSFKIIGKEIKNRRMADFHDIMNSRLPEDFNIEQNDPALNSAEIEKVLSENQREAAIKTEKVFEEFSRYDPDPAEEINIESPEMIVESNDPVDILPPSRPVIPESNSIEIPLNDRTFTILSTASLPIKRTPAKNDRESPIETLTPCRKQNLDDNEFIYKLYTQRLTNSSSTESKKRSSVKPTEYPTVKKSKQSEIIVLD